MVIKFGNKNLKSKGLLYDVLWLHKAKNIFIFINLVCVEQIMLAYIRDTFSGKRIYLRARPKSNFS